MIIVQVRRWSQPVRFPAGALEPDADAQTPGFVPGHTFVVYEHVQEGRPITLYNTREIPKERVDKEKKKGNLHIFFHNGQRTYLDSKPFSGRTKRWMAMHHQVAGLINSSLNPNAKFEEVEKYCIAMAKQALPAGTRVTINYGLSGISWPFCVKPGLENRSGLVVHGQRPIIVANENYSFLSDKTS